jgi:hypothetical protein
VSITGACLCGAVRYEIRGTIPDAGSCHCLMCRRSHGAAFATFGTVDPADFHWTCGEEFVSVYESSPGEGRLFCSICGSKLGASENGVVNSVTLGTVDGDPEIRPRSHIFVGSKASWYEINDDLPQFEDWPPGDDWA